MCDLKSFFIPFAYLTASSCFQANLTVNPSLFVHHLKHSTNDPPWVVSTIFYLMRHLCLNKKCVEYWLANSFREIMLSKLINIKFDVLEHQALAGITDLLSYEDQSICRPNVWSRFSKMTAKSLQIVVSKIELF